MKIISAQTIQTRKWITVSVNFKGKDFDISVFAIDGKVEGDGIKGLYTSYLTFFNENSQAVRIRHFKEIKKYVEAVHLPSLKS